MMSKFVNFLVSFRGELLGFHGWIIIIGAFIVYILITMLPVPFIIMFFEFVLNKLRKVKFIGAYLTWLDKKANAHGSKLGKFEYIGLMIFVAAPLPGTGAWMGAVIAAGLELHIKYSTVAIFIGDIVRGAILFASAYGILGYSVNLLDAIN